jgi:hypothetical protein
VSRVAKVQSDRDLVDSGLRALVDPWDIAERLDSCAIFLKEKATTS